jgi:hypothetical protein
MTNRIFLLGCSFLLLSSCQYGNRENDPRLRTLLEADVLYISNEQDLTIENEYYNALIEIKKLYPSELQEVIVLSQDDIRNLEEELRVKTYPTLLLIEHQEIIAKIEGENETESIINKMSNYIDTK